MLKERIIEDMKSAMRAKETARLESIRLLRAAIQRREVDDQTTLDDEGVVAVTQKQIKQSQDAITQFKQGGRDDLAEKERAHIEVLQGYLPEQMGIEEIERTIAEALDQTGATSIRDMGKVMTVVKPRLQGRADMGMVSGKIRAKLQGT